MKIILTTKGKEKFGNVSGAYWGGWEDLALICEGYARQDPFDPPPATAEEWQQLACDLVDAARRAGFVVTLAADSDTTASTPQTVFVLAGTNMEQTLRGWTMNGEPVAPKIDGNKLTFDIPEHWRAPATTASAPNPSQAYPCEPAGYEVRFAAGIACPPGGVKRELFKPAPLTLPPEATTASTRLGSNHDIADRLSLWLSSSMDDHLRQDEYRKHIRAWLEFDGNGDSLRAPALSQSAPLTIGEAFKAVGGWMNGGELGYPTFGSMMALGAYTVKMIRSAMEAEQGKSDE